VIPYKADVMMSRWPVANWVIIGVTVAASLLVLWGLPDESGVRLALWSDRNLASAVEELNARAGVVVITPEDLEGLGFHSYQLLTYAFCHGGLMHLVGNMVFLFVFGNAVNAKIGHALYVGLYLAFAVITGAAWYMLPGSGLMLVGASGAVMGVAGMFAVLYPLNEISIFTIIFYRPVVFHLSAVWVLLIYLALDVIGVIGPRDNVAHIGHVSGMLVGAGVAAALLLAALVKPGAGEKTLLEVVGISVKREDRPRTVIPIGTASSVPMVPGVPLQRILLTPGSEGKGPQSLEATPEPKKAQAAQEDLPPIDLV